MGFAEIKIPGKSGFSFIYRMLTAKQEWPRDGPKHPSCYERALHIFGYTESRKEMHKITLLQHVMHDINRGLLSTSKVCYHKQ